MHFRAVLLVGAVLFAAVVGPTRAEDAAQPTEGEADLLTLANGAVLVSASSNPKDAISLIDGAPNTSWKSGGPKQPMPHSFVFELRAPTRLSRIGVNNAIARPGGVAGGAARTFDIEASADSPDAGYNPLGTLEVEPDAIGLIEVALDQPVRWVRYTLREDHGAGTWVYFDEVIAHGEQEPVPADERFNGVFEVARKGYIDLKQDGPLLTGCYTEAGGHGGGKLFGSVENGVARVNWTSEQPGVNGAALLVIDSRGELNGIRARHKSRTAWGGPRAPDGTATPCSEAPAPANPIAEALAAEGEVRLYGILFDFDEATLKPESGPALAQLKDALAADASLDVDIEGHTDNAGGDAYNLALSERRAEAVVDWLTANGIEAARLTPVGKGEAEPVADNATADGRALNRRVEVRRKG
jgi:outer membrane protein OmpA-like peptidoglycan-associated protein